MANEYNLVMSLLDSHVTIKSMPYDGKINKNGVKQSSKPVAVGLKYICKNNRQKQYPPGYEWHRCSRVFIYNRLGS